MTKQEVKEIEKLQNKACGLLGKLQIGEFEAQVYLSQILFNLRPENAKEDLTSLITQFERMI